MRRVLPIILSVALVLMSAPAFAFSSGAYKNGDVNMDGLLSLKDATLIQLAIAKLRALNDIEKRLADYNLDKDVNMSDVTKIQRVLALLDEAPAELNSENEKNAEETDLNNSTDSALDETDTQQHSAYQSDTDTSGISVSDVEKAASYPDVDSKIDIYFTNNQNWSNVYFFLYNTETGEAEKEWPGVRVVKTATNSYGEKVYSMTVDTSKYDRVVFNDGAGLNQTANVSLNRASSGFYISDCSNLKLQLVGTYAYNGANSGKLEEINMDYPMGYKKKVWIWTPADYDPKSSDKYKTIYMTDGQNIFNFENVAYGGWKASDAVESLMSNGGRGIIIVGIESVGTKRDTELTPDIGELQNGMEVYGNYKNGKGKEFSDFVVNTVIPYVRSNYNSSAAREDNLIAGSSSGGLEAFYIGMEHHDKFCAIGALSPAFILFGDTVWKNYLKSFDFESENMPKIYIYDGKVGLDEELYPFAVDMKNRLLEGGYDKNKIKFVEEEKAEHNEAWWRLVFSEFMDWALFD